MSGDKLLLHLHVIMGSTGTNLSFTFNMMSYNTRPNVAADGSSLHPIKESRVQVSAPISDSLTRAFCAFLQSL
jgi:hypothetical protein